MADNAAGANPAQFPNLRKVRSGRTAVLFSDGHKRHSRARLWRRTHSRRQPGGVPRFMPDDSKTRQNLEGGSIEIPPIPKQTAGALAGAALGSLAGPAGAIVGGIAGAVAARNIGPRKVTPSTAKKAVSRVVRSAKKRTSAKTRSRPKSEKKKPARKAAKSGKKRTARGRGKAKTRRPSKSSRPKGRSARRRRR